ncbi:GNAT family N-acetyltransferase [Clostridium bowmanii]|uniref:GNAT family N-acetyltransferase n=1 Tax=Clostridium bowmanii TaxID=132925 RepID=UPI001C0C84A2|nr:GNAT family N-acetyltransferase [Clostridium bowmanii]MBU3191364.1 GNAT family N-acetyltransferase [Clostridium bowmanii]MCA1075791.1 GNAT family N-acetyltransferase [Clostridium bowmanii]
MRKLEIYDREDLFKYRSLPEVYKYQSFMPDNIKQIDDFINNNSRNPNIPNTWFQLAILNKNGDMLVGDIGIHFLEDNDQVEVGYTLAPKYQEQGYAIESLKAVINYLFVDLKKHRITASADPNNTNSIRLLEKVGMRKEGHFLKSFRKEPLSKRSVPYINFLLSYFYNSYCCVYEPHNLQACIY